MSRPLRDLTRPTAWLLLLAAILNFAPAQFTNESLDESVIWTRLLKDIPLLLLAIALLMQQRPSALLRRIRSLVAAVRAQPRALVHREAETDYLLGWLVIGIAAMAAVMLINAAVVERPSLGTLVSARYYLAYPGLAVLVALSPLPNLRPFAIALVLLGALQTLLGTLDYFGVFGATYYFGHVEFAGYLYPRAIGTLGNPNNLGLFLGLAIVVTIAAGEYQRRRGKLALAVLGAGVVLTASKTAFVALAVTLSPLLLRMRSSRLSRVAAIAAVLAFAALLFVVFSSRLGSPTTAFGVFGSRGTTAHNALREWTATPKSLLVGSGFASQTSIDSTGAIRETVVDNMALALGVEGGILAMLAFVLVAIAGTRLMFLRASNPRLAVAARLYATLFLVYAPLSVNFRLFPGALFFWLLAGLNAAGPPERASAATTEQRNQSRRAIAAGEPAPSVT